MGIYERPRIKGPSTFQVKIKRGNLPLISKSFPSREEAEAWEASIKETLGICGRSDSIISRLGQLAAETGKSPDVVIEEALTAYAQLLKRPQDTVAAPEPAADPVENNTAKTMPDASEDPVLSRPLSELLNSKQLKVRIAELKAFVMTIRPKVEPQAPGEEEFSRMSSTIKHYERLLYEPWHSLGLGELYSDSSFEYEYVLTSDDLAAMLQVPTEQIARMIARQEIPLPGAYSMDLAKSVRAGAFTGRIPAPDCWTVMQAAAIKAGHGPWLAERDVSPNWYNYLVAESEMALLLANPE